MGQYVANGFNPDKTKLLVTGNQDVNFEYMLDNEVIETV